MSTGFATVTVNGATTNVEDVRTIADLVVRLGIAGKRIAVERNGEVVPRSRYADTLLSRGDRLEIVGAVGGG